MEAIWMDRLKIWKRTFHADAISFLKCSQWHRKRICNHIRKPRTSIVWLTIYFLSVLVNFVRLKIWKRSFRADAISERIEYSSNSPYSILSWMETLWVMETYRFRFCSLKTIKTNVSRRCDFFFEMFSMTSKTHFQISNHIRKPRASIVWLLTLHFL